MSVCLVPSKEAKGFCGYFCIAIIFIEAWRALWRNYVDEDHEHVILFWAIIIFLAISLDLDFKRSLLSISLVHSIARDKTEHTFMLAFSSPFVHDL